MNQEAMNQEAVRLEPDTGRIAAYWERRFAAEGMIWGEAPSSTTAHAAELFRAAGVRTLWVPGAGYGRNTRALSREFRVSGTEISPAAVELARSWDPGSDIRQGSILEPAPEEARVDAVYGYDVLHLFLEEDRRKLARRILERVEEGGLLYIVCFSDEDPNCGTGDRLEPGTYKYKEGKFARFFRAGELAGLFPGCETLAEEEITEALPGPEGLHSYRLRVWAATTPGRLRPAPGV